MLSLCAACQRWNETEYLYLEEAGLVSQTCSVPERPPQVRGDITSPVQVERKLPGRYGICELPDKKQATISSYFSNTSKYVHK
jgi:hypothetical protein